jgi:divalent metal cation (Fe/Co/Zn/Cd) transporter
VLLANAYNHRSDASSSAVALVAIVGSGWFPALPLDPTGGAYIFTVDIVLCFILLLDRFFFGFFYSNKASQYSRAHLMK